MRPWLLLPPAIGALAIHTFNVLEGEDLLHDVLDEAILARTDLSCLDAAWAASRVRSDVVVSLTTTPTRLPLIDATLKSLLRQSRLPSEIRLNLPAYSRREKRPYVMLEWLARLRSVRVISCEDRGPATKLLSSLEELPADQPILVVDDDRIYHQDLIADLERARQRRPGCALGLSGWVAPADLTDRPTTLLADLRGDPPTPRKSTRIRRDLEVDVVQGFSGYVVEPRFFDLAAVKDYAGAPPEAFYVDDVWFAAHCQVPKYVVPTRRTNFQSRARGRLYRRSSLGLLNRGGGDVNRRANTVMLRHFADRWRVGGARK